MTGSPPIDFEDVERAAQRLAGVAHRTPVLQSRTANEAVGSETWFKCENLQRAGAFKFRGAYNALVQLSAAERRAGVVSFSSGNHAQALALAGRVLDVPVTLVMPTDAPKAKRSATAEYGATIVSYDRYRQDREHIAQQLADAHGLTLIPPYDHPHVMAGQGTAALELFQQVGPLDALFVPLGGGGLLAGSLVVAQQMAPSCKVYGAEPAEGNDGAQSLRSGQRTTIATPQTLADGAQNQSLGHLTFPLIQQGVHDIVEVRDEALVEAMKFFAERMKLLVEPTGCLGYAAACQVPTGLRVGVLLSGGNVDLARWANLIAGNYSRAADLAPLAFSSPSFDSKPCPSGQDHGTNGTA